MENCGGMSRGGRKEASFTSGPKRLRQFAHGWKDPTPSISTRTSQPRSAALRRAAAKAFPTSSNPKMKLDR